MNDKSDFDDAAFYGRVRAWAAEQGDTDRAPDRLVNAVMAAVEVTPRRRRMWPSWTEMWRPLAAYGALVVVVALGVTMGVLLAGRIQSVGRASNPPGPGPSVSSTPSVSLSPSGSPSPPALASPVSLTRLPDLAIDATALEWDGSSVWAVERSKHLLELDPASGSVRRSVALPRVAVDLLVTTDSVWAASPDGSLMRVARADLAVTEVDGAVGGALAEGEGVVWLGGVDGVVAISINGSAVGRRAGVPGRDAELGVAVAGSAVWVATRTEVVELDQATLATVASVPGDATRLVIADGYLWATRGSELVQIDPTTAGVVRIVAGLPFGDSLATSPGLVWVGGGKSTDADPLVGVDTGTGTIADAAPAGQLVTALAVTPTSIWAASDDGRVIHRFALPGG